MPEFFLSPEEQREYLHLIRERVPTMELILETDRGSLNRAFQTVGFEFFDTWDFVCHRGEWRFWLWDRSIAPGIPGVPTKEARQVKHDMATSGLIQYDPSIYWLFRGEEVFRGGAIARLSRGWYEDVGFRQFDALVARTKELFRWLRRYRDPKIVVRMAEDGDIVKYWLVSRGALAIHERGHRLVTAGWQDLTVGCE